MPGADKHGEQVWAFRQGLATFREEFHGSLTMRSGALFDVCDAVLCADGPVVSLPELSLVGVHRRGHGSTYAALADGRVDVDRLRMCLAGLSLPRTGGGWADPLGRGRDTPAAAGCGVLCAAGTLPPAVPL